MGKSTISMVMFNSYVKLPEGNPLGHPSFGPRRALRFSPRFQMPRRIQPAWVGEIVFFFRLSVSVQFSNLGTVGVPQMIAKLTHITWLIN